jgi:hypothetical protein
MDADILIGMSDARIQAGVIEGDLACDQCGYNLRTLPLDGVCPECAGSVLRAVEAFRDRKQPGLSGQSTYWLASGGVGFLVYLIIGNLDVFKDRLFHPPPGIRLSIWYTELGILAAAWWLITRRPKRMHWSQGCAAVMARLSVLAAFGWWIFRSIRWAHVSDPMWASHLSLFFGGCSTVLGFAWFAILAGQMRRRYLFVACFIMTVCALPMFLLGLAWACGFYLPRWMPIMIPDFPILGPVWNNTWTLWPSPDSRWDIGLPPLWVSASSLILAIMGVRLLYMAHERRTLNRSLNARADASRPLL